MSKISKVYSLSEWNMEVETGEINEPTFEELYETIRFLCPAHNDPLRDPCGAHLHSDSDIYEQDGKLYCDVICPVCDYEDQRRVGRLWI